MRAASRRANSAWYTLVIASPACSAKMVSTCTFCEQKAPVTGLLTVSVPMKCSFSINGTHASEPAGVSPGRLRRGSRLISLITSASRCSATQPVTPSCSCKRSTRGLRACPCGTAYVTNVVPRASCNAITQSCISRRAAVLRTIFCSTSTNSGDSLTRGAALLFIGWQSYVQEDLLAVMNVLPPKRHYMMRFRY